MYCSRKLISVASVAAIAVCSGAAQAAVSVFNSSASFSAATFAPATDTFATIPLDFIASPSSRFLSSYGYTVSAPGNLYGAGSAANPWLSTNLSGTTITFTGFTGGVSAIGGNFFGSDIAGAFLGGQDLTLTTTDSLGASATQTLTGATQASFVGFASNGALVSLSVSIANSAAFASIDNLVLAQAIPEPGTYALLLSGLGVLGAVARRRHRQTVGD